ITLGLPSAITLSPAIFPAVAIALSIPAVSKDTVEPSRGQPSGTLCVKTTTGAPVGCRPSQPCATSNVRRPYTITPRPMSAASPAGSRGDCSGCGLPYQANTSWTPSPGSATNPSSDTDMSATTFDIEPSLRESGFLHDLQAVAVLVAELEHGRHARPAQHVVGAGVVVEQVLTECVSVGDAEPDPRLHARRCCGAGQCQRDRGAAALR